jgi:hypothetical protein
LAGLPPPTLKLVCGLLVGARGIARGALRGGRLLCRPALANLLELAHQLCDALGQLLRSLRQVAGLALEARDHRIAVFQFPQPIRQLFMLLCELVCLSL